VIFVIILVNIHKVPEKFELFLRLGEHREFNIRTSLLYTSQN